MSKKIIISTFTGSLTRLGTPELVLDALKEAGFSYFDFTMMCPILGFELFYNSDDYVNKAKQFRKYADSIDMHCNQTHGAVPYFYKDITKEDEDRLFENVKRTIEISHILGAKYCVLHPACDCTMEENIKIFNKLKEVAHQNEITIAIENTMSEKLFGKPEDFKILLDALNDSHFKVCLDIGHAEVDKSGSSAVEFIEQLGKQIACLHIHDNNKFQDLHQLPFTMCIEFPKIFEALKKSGYSGDITFECGTYMNNMPVSLLVENLKLLHDIGEYFAKQIFE